MNAFNYFGAQLPLMMQTAPIPEPPRVIYPKPMVPDLSLISEMSLRVSPKKRVANDREMHYQSHQMDRFMTIYPSAPRPHSPPKFVYPSEVSPSIPSQGLRQNIIVDRLPSKIKVSPQMDHNCAEDANREIFEMTKRTKMTKNDASHGHKINGQNPKVIRHSEPVTNASSDRRFNCIKTAPLRQIQTQQSQKPHSSHTNEEMYELLKHHDDQLQKISEQIQELLTIHQIQEKRPSPSCVNISNNKTEKRSVTTMTSVVFDENSKPHHKNRSGPSARSTPKTPSTASKQLRDLRLPTISESPSGPSIDFDIHQLNLSQTPYNDESIEIGRDHSEEYYDHMIDNINHMLNNESFSEDSGRRSSCSPTPPRAHHRHRSERIHERHHHQYEVHTEQTLYIKKLAAKYLINEKPEHHKQKHKNVSPQWRDHRKDLKVYGLTHNASIATKNYLEKYGLTFDNNSPPRVQHKPTSVLHDTHNDHRQRFHDHRQSHNSARNRILDIDALKRQPKLT